MRTTWASSRRVGVWAARKRAVPARMSATCSEPGGQASAWRTAASIGLEPVELGVLGEEGRAKGPDHRGGVAAGLEPAVNDGPGLVDHSFLVEAATEFGQVRAARPVDVGAGQAGGRDVEEPVEEDLHGPSGKCRATNSGVGLRRTIWWTALAVVKPWWTTSQSPWSF